MAVTSNTKGAITSASNNQIAKKEAKKPNTLKDYVTLYSKSIEKALPSVLTAERFSRMVTTALTRTPKLSECSPQSFIGAMLTAAQLGLEPNTPLGQAYLIPYGKECQFQLGYRGMIELCNRTGEFRSISAHIVYENDEFDFEYGLDDKLKHKPSKSERGEPVWVYALYKLKNGGYGFEVLSVEDCMKIGRECSKAFNSSSSPWKTHPEEMMKKTAIKRVLKYAPVSSEFIRGAEASDNTTPIFTQSENDDVPPIEYIDADAEVTEETETAEK